MSSLYNKITSYSKEKMRMELTQMYRKDILSQALGELRPFCGPIYRTFYSIAAISTEQYVSVEIAVFCDFVSTLRNEEVYNYG